MDIYRVDIPFRFCVMNKFRQYYFDARGRGQSAQSPELCSVVHATTTATFIATKDVLTWTLDTVCTGMPVVAS